MLRFRRQNPTIWTDKLRATYHIRRGEEQRGIVLARWGGLGNHRYQVGFSGGAFCLPAASVVPPCVLALYPEAPGLNLSPLLCPVKTHLAPHLRCSKLLRCLCRREPPGVELLRLPALLLRHRLQRRLRLLVARHRRAGRRPRALCESNPTAFELCQLFCCCVG